MTDMEKALAFAMLKELHGIRYMYKGMLEGCFEYCVKKYNYNPTAKNKAIVIEYVKGINDEDGGDI